MMAFRMARTYTGRSKIIKFDGHFHGWSDYAMVGTSAGAAGIPSETSSTVISLPIHDIPAVERAIEQNDVAALIVESTGAHMGGEPIHPDFLHPATSMRWIPPWAQITMLLPSGVNEKDGYTPKTDQVS